MNFSHGVSLLKHVTGGINQCLWWATNLFLHLFILNICLFFRVVALQRVTEYQMVITVVH